MRSLELNLSNHRPAVSNYTQMSNLTRIALYNHDYLKGWLEYNHRFLKNENLLVQILSQLNIDSESTIEELVEWINLKKESVASTLNVAGVYNSGKTTHNIIYQPEFTELFVLAPSKSSYLDYLEETESDICPIVPIFSNETLIDYVGPTLSGPVSRKEPNKVAIIAIDLMSLGINYWRYLRSDSSLGVSMHRWLAGTPLLNARISSHRVAMLEVLYNSVLSNVSMFDQIQQIDLAPVNDITAQMQKYLTFTFDQLTKVGLYDEQDLLNKFPSWDYMSVDPLTFTGKQYFQYSNTKWIWQLPVIKMFTLINTVNKIANRGNDSVKARTQRWLTQDYKGMIRNYCPVDLRPIYTDYVNDLIESVK